MLSDDGSSIGSYALRHFDSTTPDTPTVSGQAVVLAVPEPSTAALFALGSLGLIGVRVRDRRRA